MDFSMLQRINEMGEAVKNASATRVIIDHHLGPEAFADLCFWDPKASATAELVYRLIEGLGEKKLIDKATAECIYAGISTDTGSFKHPNTTANTHLVTAALIDIGVEVTKINRLVYENNSLGKLKFISFAISHRLVLLKDCNTAYFPLA